MDFYILNKKKQFSSDLIDYDYLNSVSAPTTNSFAVFNQQSKHFDVFVYPHSSYKVDKLNRDFLLTQRQCLIVAGYAHFQDGEIRNEDIKSFVGDVEEQRPLDGDYQIVKVTEEGDGYILGSDIGWRQLYHYHDETCEVFATSIKLIVDSVKSIHQDTFVENYDTAFIEDYLFVGPHSRRDPRKTIVNRIEKLFPFDTVYFKNGNVAIEKRSEVAVPANYRALYKRDKELFYDEFCAKCLTFVENVFAFDFENIKRVTVLLTGGLDSRTTLSLMYPFCKSNSIELLTETSGDSKHPDVIIAKQIAESLSLDHVSSSDVLIVAHDLYDYRFNFYLSEGNWDTTNFIPRYDLKDEQNNCSTSLALMGADCFKRSTVDKLIGNNTWFSARTINRDPFAFPLLGTKLCGYAGLITNSNSLNHTDGTEFVYHMLRRCTPELLDVPFVGQWLPDHHVEPYKTIEDSKFHQKDPPFSNRATTKPLKQKLLRAPLNSFANSPIMKKLNRKLNGFLPRKIIGFLKWVGSHSPRSLRGAANYVLRFALLVKIFLKPNLRQNALLMDLASAAPYRKFCDVIQSIPSKPAERELK